MAEPTRAAAPLFAIFTMLFGGLVVVMAVLARSSAVFLAPLLVLGFMAIVLCAAFPSKIVVGDDGVLLTWFRGRRFVSFGSIARVERLNGDIALVLTNGGQVLLPIGTRSENDEQSEVLFKRIEQGRAALERWGSAREVEAVVQRGRLNAQSWVAKLKAMVDSGGYRAAPVDPEKLWLVVEDPSAAPSARLGAAIALGRSLDAGGCTRIRAAAGASVEPRVRVALRIASEADASDAKLLRAAAELGAEAVGESAARAKLSR